VRGGVGSSTIHEAHAKRREKEEEYHDERCDCGVMIWDTIVV